MLETGNHNFADQRLKLLFFLLKENQKSPKFHSSILGSRKKKANHLSEDLMERRRKSIAFFFFWCFCGRMGPSSFLFHCYCWYYLAQNSKINLSDSLFSSCYSLFHNCTTLFLVKWSQTLKTSNKNSFTSPFYK